MTHCVICGTETATFSNGVPQCQICALKDRAKSEQAGPQLLESQHSRVRQILKGDLQTARDRLNLASSAFEAILQDTPSGLPHPDGTQRIHNISRAYSAARQDVMIAIRRLHAFVVDGVVPDDL